MTIRHALFLILACCAQIAHCDVVYKCIKNGVTEFSATPCGPDAEEKEVDGRSPWQRREIAKPQWKMLMPAPAPLATECMDARRSSLKDPDSAKLIDHAAIIIQSTEKRMLLIAEGRAKNSFGGYVVHYFVCDFDNKGIDRGNPHGDLSSLSEDLGKYQLGTVFPGLE